MDTTQFQNLKYASILEGGVCMWNFHGKSSGSVKELEEVLLYDTERTEVKWVVKDDPRNTVFNFRLRRLDEDVAAWIAASSNHGFRAHYVEWKLDGNPECWWSKGGIIMVGNQRRSGFFDKPVVAWCHSRRESALNIWENPLKAYGLLDGANVVNLDKFAAVVMNATRRVVGLAERDVPDEAFDDCCLERYDLFNARARWSRTAPWKVGLAGIANFDMAVFGLAAQWARTGVVRVGAKGIVVGKSV